MPPLSLEGVTTPVHSGLGSSSRRYAPSVWLSDKHHEAGRLPLDFPGESLVRIHHVLCKVLVAANRLRTKASGGCVLPWWRYRSPLVEKRRSPCGGFHFPWWTRPGWVSTPEAGDYTLVVKSRAGVAESVPQVVEHDVAFGG